jgi:D-sedoheptulose 7-phosphate isomerase
MAVRRPNPENWIELRLKEAAEVKAKLAAVILGPLKRAIGLTVEALRSGKRVYVFGNGGSAADAQHLAAELEGRFTRERRALPVLALTTNTSTLTAIGNDYNYEYTFARQVEAHVSRGDVVIALSTTGRSKNVLAAVQKAKELGASVIGMTGETGGPLKDLCDVALMAPSDDTPRIQECHGTLIHILCEAVEVALFG